MHATAAAFHRRLFVTVAPRSVRARPPAPTQSAAFRLSPPALVTTWFPRSRTTQPNPSSSRNSNSAQSAKPRSARTVTFAPAGTTSRSRASRASSWSFRFPFSSDASTVRHSSGVDRPCRVAIDSATVSWPSAANDVQSRAATISRRAPTTCGTHSPKNSHVSSFALPSSRSTCFTQCFASIPRACARPAPTADTPSAADHSAPVAAFASDATRAACMSPPHTTSTNFATCFGTILRAPAIVPSLETACRNRRHCKSVSYAKKRGDG